MRRVDRGSPVIDVGSAIGVGLLHHAAEGIILVGQIHDPARILDRGHLILVVVGIGRHPAVHLCNRGEPACRIVGVTYRSPGVILGLDDPALAVMRKGDVAAIGRG